MNGSFGSKKSSFPKTKIDFSMSGFSVVLNVVPVIALFVVLSGVLSEVLTDVVLVVVLDDVVCNGVVVDSPTVVKIVVVTPVVV